MRPASNTSTSSAPSAVERRCATVASGLESLEGLSDLTLGRGIHVAGGLVEDQQPGARDLRASATSCRSPTEALPALRPACRARRARSSTSRAGRGARTPAPRRRRRPRAGRRARSPLVSKGTHPAGPCAPPSARIPPRGAGRPRRAGCALRQDRRAGTAASRTSTQPVSPTIATWAPAGMSTSMPWSTRPPLDTRTRGPRRAPTARPRATRRRDRLLDVDREVDHADTFRQPDGRLRLGEDLRQIEEDPGQVDEEGRRRAPR